ncbi:unnamed protein product [Adineta steineri]|uniref:Cyclin-dependent kinase 5 activator n=1 Tax=Adineta steineri TaxID=433720 RepID=A0A818SZV6_9BILA|nr:unnamed protein product [Adineta steineri]
MGNVPPRHSKSYRDGLNNHLSLSMSTAPATSTTTPNRSSWKKQLQIINDTLNIKKFSLRHGHGRHKRYRTNIDENNHHKLPTSVTTQNFHDLMKNNSEKSIKDEHIDNRLQQENHFTKSFSLFSIKQPLTDSTNKDIMTKSINNIIKEKEDIQQQQQQHSSLNSITKNSNNIISHKQQQDKFSMKENQTADVCNQHKRRHKFEMTTGEYISNSLVNKRHSTFVAPLYHLPKSQSQYYHQQNRTQLSSYTRINNNLSSSTKHIRTIEKHTSRKTIIQASTSELLRCLGEYLCSCCSHLLPILDPLDCILWIKSADRQLILQGWQEQVFVNPANVVFVYLLVRETLTYVIPSITIKTVTELHAIILTCLYLAFSYMGNEITYPLKPFVTDDETRDVFWQRVVSIMGQLSSKMLAINQNPKFFTECFSELKTYNLVR